MTANTDIRNVKLEFLRPGPAHNQLLSPLTPYVAVCGEDGSVTVNMPFEHRELLIRLRRLRYENGVDPARDVQRQAEVRSMGEEIGKIIGQVPSLLSAISGAGDGMVHLRLVLSPSELGMVPFEMAIAPNAFPGSGSALFLQPCAPITVTREVRRSTPLKVNWNRAPRILFAFATPAGYAKVPAQDHLNALRRAIEPWVEILDPGQDEARLEKVKKHLTVLPDATLEDIRQKCAEHEYTHVHILAHGAAYEDAGDLRFGVALKGYRDPSVADIVDGTRLAIALTARGNDGSTRSVPTFVSLATCDSGNIESVLTPGGSIAHALHMAGIPWVVASQFPLWMSASTQATEILYDGILGGQDPRRVLFDLRQRLRANVPGTHDWASIVAYATVPWDFTQQIERFWDRQTLTRSDVQFDRLDHLQLCEPKCLKSVRDETYKRIGTLREIIALGLANAEKRGNPATIAERLGLAGAAEKRIALHLEVLDPRNRGAIDAAYMAARNNYRRAQQVQQTNHWVTTQWLALEAVTRCGNNGSEEWAKSQRPWWQLAWSLAHCDYESRVLSNPNSKVWAIGSLLELSVLSVIYDSPTMGKDKRISEAVAYAQELVSLVRPENTFPLHSTIRQFKRYKQFWRNDAWNSLVDAIVEALDEPQAETKGC